MICIIQRKVDSIFRKALPIQLNQALNLEERHTVASGDIDRGADSDETNKYAPEDWMTLLEAVDALVAGLRIPYAQAKSNLIELIQDSRVDLACRVIHEESDLDDFFDDGWKYTQYQQDIFPPESNFPDLNPSKLLPLSVDFLSQSYGWAVDAARIDWRFGTIIATSPLEFHEGPEPPDDCAMARRIVDGLRVRKSSILIPAHTHLGQRSDPAGADSAQKTAGAPPKRGTSGPKAKRYNWASVLARFESEILTGSIHRLGNVTDYAMQATIEREIIAALSDDDAGKGPSEPSARRKAKQLMNAWRVHEGLEPH